MDLLDAKFDALDSLASESPIMAEAKHALEILSREPSAQRIAEMRREAELMRRLDRAEDREEGRLAALRESIEAFCHAAGIALDERRREWLGSSTVAELTATRDVLFTTRAWPGVRDRAAR